MNRLLERAQQMLDRVAPYRHVRFVVDASMRERERKKRERETRWRRLQAAENTVRAVEYQYRVAAHLEGEIGPDFNEAA